MYTENTSVSGHHNRVIVCVWSLTSNHWKNIESDLSVHEVMSLTF